MKKIFIAIVLLGGINTVLSQNLPSFQAPEPTKVYEFTKYDQIPIGEYTGVPNISIPLYSIKVDDVTVPIGLQYHAGGFRVSEEASNVGLGWNMNFGMITQTINDEDDLNPQKIKKLLKYQDSPTTGEWTIKCENIGAYNLQICNGYGYTLCTPEPEFPIGIPKVTNSIFIATDKAYPIEGISYCQTEYNLDFYNWDSEPDIFRVNFMGHSFKFIKKFTGSNQGQIEILDNKGYKVEMIQDNWKVTVSNGDQYIFGLKRKDESSSTSWGNMLPIYPSESPGSATSGNSYNNTWSLIQIITNKNKVIDFEYTDFGISPSRSYNQTLMVVTSVSQYNNNTPEYPMVKGYYRGAPELNYNNIVNIYNSTYEKALYVSKITTPSEKITFGYSGRSDRGNDRKLDLITVKNYKDQFVKDFNFGYDYFIATQSGGEVAPPQNGVYTTDYLRRLKLLSVKETGNLPYLFEYNPTQLPKKNSNAVDFWGFYNGKTTNLSMVPNPAALGFANITNNGNDKSAYEAFTKACILEKITYPTGGKIVYDFGLNEYDKSTFETTLTNAGNILASTVVKGNGLRVRSISLSDRNIQQRKTIYTYNGGKNLVPFDIKSGYSTSATKMYSTGLGRQYSDFSISEFYSSSFVRPSLLGTFNVVGYDQVTSEHIGQVGNGKTVWKFMNVRDEKSINDVTATYNKIQLPSLMKINTIENGKVLSEEIYEQGNPNPIVKKEYEYSTKQSNIHYGNSIVPFRGFIGYDVPQPNEITPRIAIQELIGYYAIYGKQSLLGSEKVTEYFPSGSKWNKTDYVYNANNLLQSTTTKDESGQIINSNNTTFYSTPDLISKNWLTLPQSTSSRPKGGTSNTVNYTYQTFGLPLPVTIEVLPGGNPNPAYKKKIVYDQYDNKGNIVEFHDEQNLYTSIIWGYDKLLPIAKIEKATYAEVSSYVVNLENLSNTGTEANLISALNNLRISLPNAMVTTYTHIPLIGLSTITDPKGDSATYVYDASNRLRYVKDRSGNILSENQYHFRP